MKSLSIILLPIAAITLSSCGTSSTPVVANDVKPLKAVFINPHKSGSYAHFKAEKSYPKNTKTWKNVDLLSRTNPSNSTVVINKSTQRAFLMNNGEVAMDYRISSGTSKHETPTGSFRITEKIVDKRSNLYGKILDSEGKVVKSNADARKHQDLLPKGGKFQGASMYKWMRLTGDGIGMHKGRVPLYPASHGCIRTPGSVIDIVYAKTKVGTSVTIK